MDKKEIAEELRNEIGHLEMDLQKVQARCNTLKQFVLELETEIAGPQMPERKTILDGKFRKVIDSVFGEKPKRHKR